MQFSTVLVLFSVAFGAVKALEPGNNALGDGLPDSLEKAIYAEVGPIAFDAFASKGCSMWSCGLKMVSIVPAVAKCAVTGDMGQKAKCIMACGDVCPCIGCLPSALESLVHKLGLCNDEFKADVFTKVYLGTATEDEKKKAEELGFNSASFAEL